MLKQVFMLAGAVILLESCRSVKLATTSIGYQSVRATRVQPTPSNPIPDDAKIAVAYTISQRGELSAIVFNRTTDIMVIDQTMSFFVNSDGTSTSYYDPTVRTTSTTDMKSKTKGGTVNLGAVSDILKIGGPLGSALGHINLGGSGTEGQSTTNATYIADQHRVSLAPKSNGAMSKTFQVNGLGVGSFGDTGLQRVNQTYDNSRRRFSVCISYSLDGGNTFEKIVTNFYVNSEIVVPVPDGDSVNKSLRQIYAANPSAIHEPWWIFHFNNNVRYNKAWEDFHNYGTIYDYQ